MAWQPISPPPQEYGPETLNLYPGRSPQETSSPRSLPRLPTGRRGLARRSRGCPCRPRPWPPPPVTRSGRHGLPASGHPGHSATPSSTLQRQRQSAGEKLAQGAHFWIRHFLRAPARPHRRPPAGMSTRKRGKLDGVVSPDAGSDRISALPDNTLHHVLSFLPAEDAVRTCMLARRWRHLWKSATGLRIGFSHGETPPSVDSLQHFVNHLLLLRKHDSCLHTCELRLRSRDANSWLVDEDINLNLWIRHVIEREVRMLRLEIHDSFFGFHLDRPATKHLKTLALISVMLYSPCNFSYCPNLEHLEIAESYIYEAPQISSKSLRHLSISDCYFSYKGSHTLICTPNLVSLRLDGHFASVPVLGSMPTLKEAFVRDHNLDCETKDCFSCADDDNDVTPDESDSKNKCFVLQGLSQAENLTLMCDYNGVVFHRDLERCPTFNNLRALLLNEWWCKDPEFYGLNLILNHSPALEKLNLHLFTKGPQYKVEMIGRYNQMEAPATILKHLKEIEVKCDVVNEQVHKVLKFLGTFGIPFLFK